MTFYFNEKENKRIAVIAIYHSYLEKKMGVSMYSKDIVRVFVNNR